VAPSTSAFDGFASRSLRGNDRKCVSELGTRPSFCASAEKNVEPILRQGFVGVRQDRRIVLLVESILIDRVAGSWC
jgi:hypothetical protein